MRKTTTAAAATTTITAAATATTAAAAAAAAATAAATAAAAAAAAATAAAAVERDLVEVVQPHPVRRALHDVRADRAKEGFTSGFAAKIRKEARVDPRIADLGVRHAVDVDNVNVTRTPAVREVEGPVVHVVDVEHAVRQAVAGVCSGRLNPREDGGLGGELQ